MEVAELWDLTQWIQKNIGDAKLAKRLGALQGQLQQNTQPNQPKVAFEDTAKAVTDLMRAMPMSTLSKAQLDFLEKLGIAELLGEAGAEYIDGILYRNQLDIATANQRIQQTIDRLNKALEKINQIRIGLDGLFPGKQEPPPDSAVIRVTFDHEAAIKNVVLLKKWSTNWYDITRGLAMAQGLAPEDVKVIGAQRGSIVIDLLVVLGYAKLFSYIVMQSLEATQRVHNIRKTMAEVRALDLGNELAEAQLKKDATKVKAERVESITRETVQMLKLRQKDDGEAITLLEKSVRLTIEFLDKGGDVDIVVQADTAPAAEEDDNSKALRDLRNEVRQCAEKMRALEHQVKGIEYKPDEDQTEEDEDSPES